jgi:hypothetical protein
MSGGRVATWNLRWRGPKSDAAPVIRARLDSIGPDVAVLTETRMSTLTDWPVAKDAGLGVYKGSPADGAKVAIVAKRPCEVVNATGNPDLPPGNFLALDVDTDFGSLRVIGIVIRYNQKSAYVDALPAALERTVTERTVLAGDFNLKIPAGGLATRLDSILRQFDLTVRTAGEHGVLADERPLVDHIAASVGLASDALAVWPRRDPAYRDGRVEVTDHAGAALTVRPASP